MSTQVVSKLRLRMIEDMTARQLNPHTQRSHIYSCKRLAAYLKRSPAAATADEVRAFQLYLMETGPSICNRNRIMTGVKFLFRVTLRRHDLASEIYYVREPQKLPLTVSQAEAMRLLAMAGKLKVKVMLTLCYGCGLRAGEVCRLKAGDIDSELNVIRIVQDIFRDHGAAWREANRGHVSLGQLKVMSAIERCRTAALGGHVARCENDACRHTLISFNSCRDRHCPKCQASAAREWLAERQAELLPVPYFHVVFTLPAPIACIAYQNKAAIYGILFKASAETMLRVASDPKRLGARIGITSVLHTWGSAMTHHPHVHMIVPGGGLSADGRRWICGRPDYLLPVPVLSRLFRGIVLSMLLEAHGQGRLKFFGEYTALAGRKAFKAFLAPMRNSKWVVYAKRPFAGPDAVLAYLARYTHRVAISNRRLIAANADGVTFKYKDYRIEGPPMLSIGCSKLKRAASGGGRYKTMTLAPHEFIRRFLLHVLPRGFHRIRHYGLLANGGRAENIANARALLGVLPPALASGAEAQDKAAPEDTRVLPRPCSCCGGRMIVIEVFARGSMPRHRPPDTAPAWIDTS